MQNLDHLADMTTGDTVRVSRLRAYCQAGRWWPVLREECHGDRAGEKYGNLEDPLVTGHWAGVFLQEALNLSHTFPEGRVGTSLGIQRNGLSL